MKNSLRKTCWIATQYTANVNTRMAIEFKTEAMITTVDFDIECSDVPILSGLQTA